MALISGAAASAIVFLVRLWFKNIEIMNFVGAKDAIFYFFTYYVLFIPFFFISFLGGEICWRGYLWQKWKNHPFKGGMAIWLLWCLSSIPLVINTPQRIPYMAFYNLMLMPILHFFRYRSGAIGPGTLFYASYLSDHLQQPFNKACSHINSGKLVFYAANTVFHLFKPSIYFFKPSIHLFKLFIHSVNDPKQPTNRWNQNAYDNSKGLRVYSHVYLFISFSWVLLDLRPNPKTWIFINKVLLIQETVFLYFYKGKISIPIGEIV